MLEDETLKNQKSKNVIFVLWLFLGIVGAHKFYLGKKGMGIAYLFTCGFVGVGWIFDLFTLFAEVDVYNGLRSKEDIGFFAGLNKLLSISQGMQKISGASKANRQNLVMCKYCGQTHSNPMVFTSSYYPCSRSPTGRHVLK